MSGGPIPNLGALCWGVPHCSALLLSFAGPLLLKTFSFAIIIDSKEVAKQSCSMYPSPSSPSAYVLAPGNGRWYRVCPALLC